MAMTNFGSGIWLYSRRTRDAILKLTVPATIIRSAWRGVARKAPAPKRSMSKRLAPVAIISIAQHARPNVIGHSDDSRAQLIACSSDVVMTDSSFKCPSSQPIKHQGSGVRGQGSDHSRQRRATGFFHGGRRGVLGRGTADPVDVAAAPHVREADQQHRE